MKLVEHQVVKAHGFGVAVPLQTVCLVVLIVL